jgi:hypothetical protein
MRKRMSTATIYALEALEEEAEAERGISIK